MKKFKVLIKVEEFGVNVPDHLEDPIRKMVEPSLLFRLDWGDKGSTQTIICSDENPEKSIRIYIGDVFAHLEAKLMPRIKTDWKDDLRKETISLSERVNKLHDYFKTPEFYKLGRQEKDLLYDQNRSMMLYLQTLGKRCELHGIKLFQNTSGGYPENYNVVGYIVNKKKENEK